MSYHDKYSVLLTFLELQLRFMAMVLANLPSETDGDMHQSLRMHIADLQMSHKSWVDKMKGKRIKHKNTRQQTYG